LSVSVLGTHDHDRHVASLLEMNCAFSSLPRRHIDGSRVVHPSSHKDRHPRGLPNQRISSSLGCKRLRMNLELRRAHWNFRYSQAVASGRIGQSAVADFPLPSFIVVVDVSHLAQDYRQALAGQYESGGRAAQPSKSAKCPRTPPSLSTSLQLIITEDGRFARPPHAGLHAG
jgi:hypothetical protein